MARLDAAALLNEIDRLFDQVPRHAANSRRIEDLYEAFLMGLVLEAARRIDPRAVTWHGPDGEPASRVRLRAGPGEAYSPNFTHARVTLQGHAVYEVHLGV